MYRTISSRAHPPQNSIYTEPSSRAYPPQNSIYTEPSYLALTRHIANISNLYYLFWEGFGGKAENGKWEERKGRKGKGRGVDTYQIFWEGKI